MAKDITLLKCAEGEKVDESQRQEMNVEKMLAGLLRSLLEEQCAPVAAAETAPDLGGNA